MGMGSRAPVVPHADHSESEAPCPYGRDNTLIELGNTGDTRRQVRAIRSDVRGLPRL